MEGTSQHFVGSRSEEPPWGPASCGEDSRSRLAVPKLLRPLPPPADPSELRWHALLWCYAICKLNRFFLIKIMKFSHTTVHLQAQMRLQHQPQNFYDLTLKRSYSKLCSQNTPLVSTPSLVKADLQLPAMTD